MKCKIWCSPCGRQILESVSCMLTEMWGFQVYIYMYMLLSPAVVTDTSTWPCLERKGISVFEGRSCQPHGFVGMRARSR